MTKTTLKLVVLIAFACCSIASAQWEGVGGSPHPINPNSGMTINPKFFYDADDGKLYLDAVGPNGTVDSPDNLTLLGDDGGMISTLLSYNGDVGDVSAILDVFVDNIAWSAPTVFNNKIQLSGNAIGASFLPVRDTPTPIVQLPTGLTMDAFTASSGKIELETGQNFTFGSAGVTLFDNDAGASGNFFIRAIPEPSSLVLVGIAMLGGLGLRRRRY